jgi:hypothetical protein
MYGFTTMLRRLISHHDLALTTGAAILASLLTMAATVPQYSLLALLGALPLIAWLPGYALTAWLFAGAKLGHVEQVVYSVTLSLVITVLIGLLFHFLPLGLRREVWQVALPLVTVVCCLIAAQRRPPEQRLRLPRLQLGLAGWAGLGAGALIVLTAMEIARTPAPTTGLTGYTSFWMVPSGALQQSLDLGIQSEEFAEAHYILRLETVDSVLAEWTDIVLSPGKQWRTTIQLAPTDLSAAPLYGRLYRYNAANQLELYREGVWWPQKPERDS